jgi:hypothetical protein
MNEFNFDEIQSFVSEFRGTEKEELTPETTLYWDLGIYGDDAFDFMLDFFNKYEIDRTGFCFDKYFLPEDSVRQLFHRLFNSRESSKYLSITLQHLFEVAKAKKWFDVSGVPLY